jgi:hypothetical protein
MRAPYGNESLEEALNKEQERPRLSKGPSDYPADPPFQISTEDDEAGQ